ncbi:hypothetical protein GE278_23735 (plasmid) [Enterobacteriaceae bacterium Kacie_13]|nr:hypothetical protein GE278_23735 [Enterobacteriaceae bacterium Kacie_13]
MSQAADSHLQRIVLKPRTGSETHTLMLSLIPAEHKAMQVKKWIVSAFSPFIVFLLTPRKATAKPVACTTSPYFIPLSMACCIT